MTQKIVNLCEICRERPATERWVVHWDGRNIPLQNRCAVCVLNERLAYARDLAATIPVLEQQLAELLGREAAA